MECSEAEEGVHERCCLHELPASSKHFPGTVCCWCGDVFLPFDTADCASHGQYLPRVFRPRKKKQKTRKRR